MGGGQGSRQQRERERVRKTKELGERETTTITIHAYYMSFNIKLTGNEAELNSKVKPFTFKKKKIINIEQQLFFHWE